MQHEWLIDVLADLKTFARGQGLGALAAALDDASLVAMAELTSRARAEAVRKGAGENDGETGSVTYLFAERGHA